MEAGTTGPIHFLNLEYFFRLLYGSQVAVTGGGVPGVSGLNFFDVFVIWFSHAWGVLGVVAFLFVVVAFGVLTYASVRLYQIRHTEDHEKYSTLKPEVAEKQKDHARWKHIQMLVESAHENDWRQAIIEADIMLEEVLNQAGYSGDSIGDKLKGATFASLADAWEAHKIRNDIAHRGSAFKLDNTTAYRTIKRFERVFKEFGEI